MKFDKNVLTMTSTLSGKAFFEIIDGLKDGYIDMHKIYRVKISIKEKEKSK